MLIDVIVRYHNFFREHALLQQDNWLRSRIDYTCMFYSFCSSAASMCIRWLHCLDENVFHFWDCLWEINQLWLWRWFWWAAEFVYQVSLPKKFTSKYDWCPLPPWAWKPNGSRWGACQIYITDNSSHTYTPWCVKLLWPNKPFLKSCY